MEETEHGLRDKRSTARVTSDIAILAATALGGNFILFITPNIELSSVTVFLSGFLYGNSIGALVGLIAMGLFQLWNPLGFILPIGVASIVCTMFTGVVGGIAGRRVESTNAFNSSWNSKLGLLGVVTTLFYDLVTNFVFGYVFGWPFVFTLASGFLFSLLHIISNALLFGLLVPPVIRAVKHLSEERIGGAAQTKINNRATTTERRQLL